MTPEQQISENAALIVTECRPLSGFGPGFGYNRQSVEWLDGYIERLRADGRFSPGQIENMSELFACFLGECIRATYGGEWRKRDGTWGVFFEDSSAVFPFSKVRRQFESGNESGESILGLFDVLPEILSGRIHQRPVLRWLRSILKRLVR